jgi:hypothetical protein
MQNAVEKNPFLGLPETIWKSTSRVTLHMASAVSEENSVICEQRGDFALHPCSGSLVATDNLPKSR